MVTVENKTLLVAEVYLSGTRPHFLKALGPEEGVFVRLGSSNRQADRPLIGELRRTVEGTAFDEMPMPELRRVGVQPTADELKNCFAVSDCIWRDCNIDFMQLGWQYMVSTK